MVKHKKKSHKQKKEIHVHAKSKPEHHDRKPIGPKGANKWLWIGSVVLVIIITVFAYNGNTVGLELDSKLTARYNSIEKLEYLTPHIALLVGEGLIGDLMHKIDDILS